MTPTTDPKNAQPSTESRHAMTKEIHTKWDKFSEKELSELKNKDDLITQVVSKYGLEKGQAQRDVDAFLKGRQL